MTEPYNGNNEEREEQVQYFCRFTFGQFFTILVLEVITFGFVFYLGARYGNDYIKVGQERATVTEVVAAGQPPSSPAAVNNEELQAMAKDALGGSKDSQLKERVKELLEKGETAQAPATAPTNIVAPSEMPKPETNNAQVAMGQASAAPQESGAVRVKSPLNAQFSVQVGSYPNIDEANTKITEWRGKGYPAFMMIADIPDRGRWYRVRLGGFSSKEEAQKYLDQVKSRENTEAIIVLNEQ